MTTMGQWRRLRGMAPRASEPGETSNYRVREQGCGEFMGRSLEQPFETVILPCREITWRR